MLFLLFFFAQWHDENLEAKFVHHYPTMLSERAESLHTYDVLKYELAVDLPMTQRSMQGFNTIICRSRVDNLNTLPVHSSTLVIDSVFVDGASATYTPSGDSIIINLPFTYNSNDSFVVQIGYHGSWGITFYQTGFVYYPKGYNSGTLHSIAYTLGEPWDARRWMPCYDEPFDKADYGCMFAITVPDTFIAGANGILTSVVANPNNTTTYTWEEHYPITTYLMHFTASRYTPWSQWCHTASGDSIETIHFVWPEDSIQSISAFSDIPDAMYLFDSLYGDYPFDRYGQDVVYPYSWGGMEHQELTTMHRNCVGGSQGWRRIMAHELAHMWWGDMVTCIDFRDLWLNEGCATYSDANYIWYIYGYGSFINLMQSRAQTYFDEDPPYRRPLYDPPLDSLFDYGYTYCKASWVMHMLRYLDQNSFFPTMQVYRDSFEYGCASTEDMKAIFSQEYGSDLTWFFDEWVYGQGYPEYEVYWYCVPSGNDYRAVFNICQVQSNAPPVFHMPLEITLHTNGGDTLVTTPVQNSPQHAEYTLPDSVTSITFDPNYWLLCMTSIFHGVAEYSDGKPLYNDLFFSSNPAKHPKLTYVISQPGNIDLSLYDIAGRVVRNLYQGSCNPGQYTMYLTDIPAGIYFCHLKTSTNERIKKLVKLH